MKSPLTDEQIHEALKSCADEPVHIPGTIQPIGFLLACEHERGDICQASENCDILFGKNLRDIFQESVSSLLGARIWHGILNATGTKQFENGRCYVGQIELKNAHYSVYISPANERCVVEIEPLSGSTTEPDSERYRAHLVQQIDHCGTLTELLDTSVEFIRHLTGYERVSIITFDDQWNGKVVAEARSNLVEPLLGLCFPSHDIPAQAREIMRLLPLRIIADVHQKPVRLIARSPQEPPLDMTHTVMRGVSSVHMQYLHNFGVAATMTMSIVIRNELWGYVSFHSLKPYVPPSDLRQLLLSFLPLLKLKIELLEQEEELRLSYEIDKLQTDLKRDLTNERDLQATLDRVGPSILSSLDGCGIVMTHENSTFKFGDVPSANVISTLTLEATKQPEQILTVNGIKDFLPKLTPDLKGIAGAIVIFDEGGRCLQLFRREITDKVHWAGNPTKAVETVGSKLRIQPRNSFSSYLEEVKGKSKPWSKRDRHLMQQLWPLLSAAERQTFFADLTRQQQLMIHELNHRVRNILSLVKSVSTQARKTGGSLESYSHALEARIFALAAAHDIGSGASKSSVSIFSIVEMEAAPYLQDGFHRLILQGSDASVRADIAPIFGLVIHELMTNAVKYGSFSVPEGRIVLKLTTSDDGLNLDWTELHGPRVSNPKALGFGTTLIRQAIPYEMDGTAVVDFEPDGLRAKFKIPSKFLSGEDNLGPAKPLSSYEDRPLEPMPEPDRFVLVLEDNFMVAQDIKRILLDLGFRFIELVPSVVRAQNLLDQIDPDFAIVDINLGADQTSFKVAEKLLERGVPFVFVTGYGEQFPVPTTLKDIDILTKPVTEQQLENAIDRSTQKSKFQ